jgi:hypothetical protein
MKKCMKIIIIVILLLVTSFTISNFISVELKAPPGKGSLVNVGGDKECMGLGDECDKAGGGRG